MIGSLNGVLIVKSLSDVIVEAGGVGYQVSVPVNALSELPPEGEKVFLYIYTHVREDTIHLYGFLTQEEKRVFLLLLGISGIGPKLALNVISSINHDDFLSAVEAEDITLLTSIPGLGKKTAHRLILELRGKLPKREAATDSVFNDTLSALINLGYKKSEAYDVLQKARKNVGSGDIEILLTEALKHLTGNAE